MTTPSSDTTTFISNAQIVDRAVRSHIRLTYLWVTIGAIAGFMCGVMATMVLK